MLLSFCPWESLGFYRRNIPSQSTMAIIYGGGCVQITTAPKGEGGMLSDVNTEGGGQDYINVMLAKGR